MVGKVQGILGVKMPCYNNYLDAIKDAFIFYHNTLGMNKEDAHRCAIKEAKLEYKKWSYRAYD